MCDQFDAYLLYNIPVKAEAQLYVKVDGKIVNFPDAKPYINKNNRTMVPLRFVGESLGAEFEWQEETRTVVIKKGGKKIIFSIGTDWLDQSKKNWVDVVDSNGNTTRIKYDSDICISAPEIISDRVYVPLRFVAQILGAGVAWDDVNNTAVIRSDGTVEEVPKKVYPGGWTVGEKPIMEKRQIQVGNGMTLDIALSDPLISQLMELPGLSSVAYYTPDKTGVGLNYNEYHSNGIMDSAMVIEYTFDKKNFFFHVERDSEETVNRLKKAIEILFLDYPEMQKQIFDEIMAYKTQGGYLGYQLNENYRILVKKISTTWAYDDKPFGVWCVVTSNFYKGN